MSKDVPYPYDALFRAIGDAVNIEGTAVAISVKQFVETLGSKGHIVVTKQEIETLKRERDYNQSVIDRLMLEYCPEEMTQEQIDNWAAHQRKVTAEKVVATLDKLKRKPQ